MIYTEYDPFAWFYNRHWGADYHTELLPVLDRLLLDQLAPGARVLDLCCGTGKISRVLCDRGFHVVGVDGSSEMLRYARENSPQAEFIAADAREFHLARPVDAAFSVFDSLNHVLDTSDLRRVFACVRRCLAPGGVFLFDLNRAPAFERYWNETYAIVEENDVCVARARYAEAVGTCELTMFRRDGDWHRADATIRQRCHDEGRVDEMLREAGFAFAKFDAAAHLGMKGASALARTFWRTSGR